MSTNPEIEHQIATEVKQTGGKTAFKDYIGKYAHIEDPLERRRLALEDIDKSGFGWTQVKMIMIAGVGFMTDSYDIFAINLSVNMLQYVYWSKGAMPNSTTTLIKVATSVGTVIGQVGFGVMADKVGRKKIYGLELIVMICATIAQCFIGSSPAINFVALFSTLRIIMGIGIGGDYPLSSIISSEFSTTKWRGAIMAAVFSNQGIGQIFAGIVAMICVAGYKNDLIDIKDGPACHASRKCVKAADQMWRIIIGFGCVPGCIALYYRLTIAESPRYSLDIDEHGDVQKVADAEAVIDEKAGLINPPKASFVDFWRHFGQWRYGKILLGTAGSWFMLDVAFYGLGLNTTTILQVIGYASKENIYKKLYDSCAGNLILVCAGSLPGYWVSVATIDTLGRKTIQLGGFILLTIILCIMGFGYHKIHEKGVFGLFVIAQFFQNFGPNTTTFIIPGEVFPTRYRSTAHGLSAASGKVGAIIAQTCIGTLINHNCGSDPKNQGCFLPHVLEIFALFMLIGIFTTLLVPETKRQTLEHICEKHHDEVDTTKLVRDRYATQEESYDSDVKQ
ncbi:PHO84 [Candida jiufengensis]|uniref:PHO84 n=1 Tax=Candida jiufengensis TaxID=497108 RepID=UPI002224EDA3|nr:PHO84 [Candida jiufengensis]KAI5951610.1 PHO84 [Candida jiufengensis]